MHDPAADSVDPARLQFVRLQKEFLPDVLVLEHDAYPDPWTQGMFHQEMRNGPSHFYLAYHEGVLVAYGGFWMILDEVHQLQYTYRRESFFACVEVIREIYDSVECGMVLCTTNVFRSRFESARKEELEQLFRRGGHQVQLGDIVRVEDLRPILTSSGLEWPDRNFSVEIAGVSDQPHEVLRKLAREGGLKAITERIRYGRRLATNALEPLSWAHFIHAHLIIETGAAAPKDDWK